MDNTPLHLVGLATLYNYEYYLVTSLVGDTLLLISMRALGSFDQRSYDPFFRIVFRS